MTLPEYKISSLKKGIEGCILRYMSKNEAMNALLIEQSIEPLFTELVWEKLEKDNPVFFKAFYVKLLVKDQIKKFNRLLAKQVKLMHKNGLTRITPVLTSNGAHVSSKWQMSTKHAAQTAGPLKIKDMQQNVIHNCGSVQSCVQGTVDSRQVDVSHNSFLFQDANVGFIQTMNGKTEAGYAGSPPFNFSTGSNFLESRPRIGDASVSPFSSVGSDAQHPDDALLNWNSSSFGLVEQIPQTFSPELAADFTSSNSQHPNDAPLDWDAPSEEFLAQVRKAFCPALAADFTSSCGLPQCNCRPPFPATDPNTFVVPHGDVETLDPSSKSLRYPFSDGA